ncbi:Chemotaxis protein methyltransferase [Rhodovulum sp. P5]|uniref:CheR family methyltransferase n=1 Tax=Rhodovulum sp. P5 TaxID=1564506 RepID=UPI0009C25DAF|nr:CheR family methyltransferase [Rhodovulum sp. P5]ARE38361.1 Chemotaxis protein methyltransferase [Rhodovulum sp. P5]
MIGIGASAGGLSALETFFETCPCDSGAAFVVIQHLSPKHESLMADLLSRRTRMPVKMLDTDSKIEPDHVYLIPPGAVMRVEGDVLKLSPRSEVLSLPIDIFFASMAENFGENAIGIVLSGTGSDGTRGSIAINAAGGLVLIQDPEEAKFDGMPLSVRRAGVADEVLPAAKLAERAILHHEHPTDLSLRPAPDAGGSPEAPPVTPVQAESDALEAIFDTLSDESGIDFRSYKSTTIMRRLGRRMQVRRVGSLRNYLDVLVNSAEELTALRRELLISVTRFFRDEESFKVLEERVIPRIVEGLSRHDTARVWVAGCSTGEEAYSIAMLLHEAFGAHTRTPQIKIFATDVNEDNLQFAAAGTYPSSIAAEVSPERLERFFTQDRETLTVSAELRQSLVFARHDLLADAPFTRMDLVSCRNTLIYFRRDAQERALKRLQYAVRHNGFLFLGNSESISATQNGFQSIDTTNKIFTRVSHDKRSGLDVSSGTAPAAGFRSGAAQGTGRQPMRHDTTEAAKRVEKGLVVDTAMQALLDRWAPPSIIVNSRYEAVHFQGDLRPYMRTRSGKASLDLTRILPDTLAAVASVLARKAYETGAEVVSEPLEFKTDDTTRVVKVYASPVSDAGATTSVLLSFEPIHMAGETCSIPQQIDLAAVAQARIDILESQLDATRADLQSTIEELETSNEELQATNEELMASNEELQSSNEELQSVNEEINTVNAEYQEKVSLLNRLNGDLSSMIRAVGVATVFLDETLSITRFSPDACSVFKLRESDVGRPLEDIAHRLKYTTLIEDIHETIRTENRCEREVVGDDGELYRVRIVPYSIQTSGQRGAVLTIMNVTVYRDVARLQGIIDALPEHVAVLDFDGTIMLTNAAWTRFARANGDPNLNRSGPGANYLEICREANTCAPDMEKCEDALSAARAYEGVKEILEGSRATFSLEYPCHSPEQERWFYMTAAPVVGREFAAVVSHIEITSWFKTLGTQE